MLIFLGDNLKPKKKKRPPGGTYHPNLFSVLQKLILNAASNPTGAFPHHLLAPPSSYLTDHLFSNSFNTPCTTYNLTTCSRARLSLPHHATIFCF